jgi:hypothetical protein
MSVCAARATVAAAVAAYDTAAPRSITDTVHEKYRAATSEAKERYTSAEADYAAVCATDPTRPLMVFVGYDSPAELQYHAAQKEFEMRKAAAAAILTAASRAYSRLYWEYDAALKQA